jgi:hypothetical protein
MYKKFETHKQIKLARFTPTEDIHGERVNPVVGIVIGNSRGFGPSSRKICYDRMKDVKEELQKDQ